MAAERPLEADAHGMPEAGVAVGGVEPRGGLQQDGAVFGEAEAHADPHDERGGRARIAPPLVARRVEAGDALSEAVLATLIEAGIHDLPILDIDPATVGPYIRNTLKLDKNENREQALFDIYRVMRPGEPPTIDTAETLFNALFSDGERYDLSAVGRVKMNMRLELDARFARRADTFHYNERYDMYFVHDHERYWLFNNCNQVTARWLRRLGCRVGGLTLTNDFRVLRSE